MNALKMCLSVIWLSCIELLMLKNVFRIIPSGQNQNKFVTWYHDAIFLVSLLYLVDTSLLKIYRKTIHRGVSCACYRLAMYLE